MDLFYRFDFAAARRLPQLPPAHPCSRVHGHTFQVELRLRGEIAAETGWLVDFDLLDQLVDSIKGALDHRYLNDIAGLAVPTTEHLAMWLWRRLVADLPALSRVSVQEHPSRGVHYYGPDTT
jgi:6-pyruvoyltetrahydropterin/6-carboxytetrahydropterin synthase